MKDIWEIWLQKGQTVVQNVLLENYLALGLNDTELVFLIQLEYYLNRNVLFPNMNDIAVKMGKEEVEIFAILHSLIQKKCLQIRTEKDETGKVSDQYSLDPLYQKLSILLVKEDKNKENEKKNAPDLLSIFQQEFGRLLTPIEIQTISEWLDRDHYSKEIILEALREAVLNQKYNLRYIDRILLSWEKKNIRTSNQIKQQNRKYHELKTEQASETEEKIPLFNWLDPDEE